MGWNTTQRKQHNTEKHQRLNTDRWSDITKTLAIIHQHSWQNTDRTYFLRMARFSSSSDSEVLLLLCSWPSTWEHRIGWGSTEMTGASVSFNIYTTGMTILPHSKRLTKVRGTSTYCSTADPIHRVSLWATLLQHSLCYGAEEERGADMRWEIDTIHVSKYTLTVPVKRALTLCRDCCCEDRVLVVCKDWWYVRTGGTLGLVVR